jgi:hypothetical protein
VQDNKLDAIEFSASSVVPSAPQRKLAQSAPGGQGVWAPFKTRRNACREPVLQRCMSVHVRMKLYSALNMSEQQQQQS